MENSIYIDVLLMLGQATPGLLFLLGTQVASHSASTRVTILLTTSPPTGECTLICRKHNLYYG